jgi:hypothetical protein
MSSELTPDDIAFLRRSGGMPSAMPERKTSASKKEPRFPRKTTIGLLVVFGLLTVLYAAMIQSVKPYAELAQSSVYSSISNSTSSEATTLKNNIGGSNIDAANQIYTYSGYGYVIIWAVAVLCLMIPIIVYWVRKSRWNHERS